MNDDQVRRALERIANSSNADELSRMAANARSAGEEQVHRAAVLKLYSILPSAEPGSLEHDVWQSIHALEGELAAERGKTVRLSRTRQKIQRDGEAGTVAALVKGPESDGFRMLRERQMLDLTFEAVALRHRDRFSDDVLDHAARRLREHNFQLPGAGSGATEREG